MKNETLILIGGVAIIALLVIARFFFQGRQATIALNTPPAPVPATSTSPSTQPVLPVPAPMYPEDPNPVQPRPPGTVCDTKNFICVSRDLVNATLTNPISATGTAIAFESTFQWKLENASSTQIAGGTLMANAPDIGQPGPFTLNQPLTLTPIGPHTLTFFEYSAKDGTPIHLLAIPVTF